MSTLLLSVSARVMSLHQRNLECELRPDTAVAIVSDMVFNRPWVERVIFFQTDHPYIISDILGRYGGSEVLNESSAKCSVFISTTSEYSVCMLLHVALHDNVLLNACVFSLNVSL